MARTSVHFPPSLIRRLDLLAMRRGTSRNRVILHACEIFVNGQRGDWPPGSFDEALSDQDQALLREVGEEMEEIVYNSRRDRPVPSI